MTPAAEPLWIVEVDRQKCTLCEVCAQKCPTGALKINKKASTQTLTFEQALCDGCSGEVRCRELCPESCIEVPRADNKKPLKKVVQLAAGRIARCAKCGTVFAAQKKLSTVRRRAGAPMEPGLDRHCPTCRRDHLLSNLIP